MKGFLNDDIVKKNSFESFAPTTGGSIVEKGEDANESENEDEDVGEEISEGDEGGEEAAEDGDEGEEIAEDINTDTESEDESGEDSVSMHHHNSAEETQMNEDEIIDVPPLSDSEKTKAYQQYIDNKSSEEQENSTQFKPAV